MPTARSLVLVALALAACRGPVGPKGTTTATGATGTTGPIGVTGAGGTNGPIGVAGSSGCGPDACVAIRDPLGRRAARDLCAESCQGTPVWYCGYADSDAGPACNLNGGAPSLAGSWKGWSSEWSCFAGGVPTAGCSPGAGTDRRDTEVVAAVDGGVEFPSFLVSLTPPFLGDAGCPLTFILTSATSANLLPGTTCGVDGGDTFTYECGTASLDATGCVMTVLTSGTGINVQVPGPPLSPGSADAGSWYYPDGGFTPDDGGPWVWPDGGPRYYTISFTTSSTLYLQ